MRIWATVSRESQYKETKYIQTVDEREKEKCLKMPPSSSCHDVKSSLTNNKLISSRDKDWYEAVWYFFHAYKLNKQSGSERRKETRIYLLRPPGRAGGCTYSGKSAGYFETPDLASNQLQRSTRCIVCRSESALQQMQFNFKTYFYFFKY